MQNFRPNIVVDGCSKPFEEDLWSRVEFVSASEGNSAGRKEGPKAPPAKHSGPTKMPLHKPLPMKVVRPCARCKLPTVDVDTGAMSPENEPTVTMRTYRTGKKMGYANKDWANQVWKYRRFSL
jgi:hypothetical protein